MEFISLIWKYFIDKIMKPHSLFLMLSLMLLGSCTGFDAGTGNVSVCIENTISPPLSVEVKSSETEVTPEQIDAFTLWIDGSKIRGTYAAIKNETYKLKVGDYTACAESCTAEYAEANPDSYGCVRYYGESAFEVKSLETTQNVSIECSIANARVAVLLTDDFSSYFVAEVTDVMISDTPDFSSRALQMITDGEQISGESIKTAYFSAGDTVYARVTARKQGADKEITYTVPVIRSASASTSYTVMLSVDESTTTGGITFVVNGNDMTTNDFLSIDSYTPGTWVEDK